MNLYIGLISGTSMDGVDAALVDVATHQCLAGITCPYDDKAKRFLEDVLHQNRLIHLGTLSQLNSILGCEFGKAALALLEKAQCSAREVVAIGSHGQTICHDVTAEIPYTVQLACPHTIAEMTGIRVVADFRTRDLVVGGKGAPFAPLYHYELFASYQRPILVVNIGGIANVTFIEASQPPRGYDTGPGNCLMDAWVRHSLRQPYDADGAWASGGQVIEPLLLELLSDPYFQQPAPKSIGKEYFSLDWLLPKLQQTYSPQHIQATLLELTAVTISRAIKSHPTLFSNVVLCGGGVHNTALQQVLQQHVGEISVVSSAAFGVHPDFLEAMMFAWLAEKTMQNKSLDLSALTGAKKRVILGSIYPI